MEVRIFPIGSDEEGGTEVIGVTIDITEWKNVELDLEFQIDQLNQFTDMVSHDLRNPLNVAQGQIDLALENHESDEHLEVAATALDRMEELIHDMLAFAQIDGHTWAKERVHLGTIVDDCWQNVVTGEAAIDNQASQTILADRGKTKQVFENLIRNSIEHGDSNVSVTIGNLEDGFYVEDDGPGIQETIREEVFKAGFSTQNDGTGYGLSIVKEIVDGHDWQIQITDSDGGGTRVEISNVEIL